MTVKQSEYSQAYHSVSDEVHEFFRSHGDQATRSGWAIARMTKAMIDGGVSRMHAYKIAAEDSRMSERSIRLYCQALDTIPEGDIEELCTAGLGIAHFAAAMQSEAPLEALQWAVKAADDRGGRIARVDEIYARWVLSDTPGEPEPRPSGSRPGWFAPLDRFVATLPQARREHWRRVFDEFCLEAFG